MSTSLHSILTGVGFTENGLRWNIAMLETIFDKLIWTTIFYHIHYFLLREGVEISL